MQERYKVTVWHGEAGSHATVYDTKTGRAMGHTSTFRDGAAWRELADIQARALNKASGGKRGGGHASNPPGKFDRPPSYYEHKAQLAIKRGKPMEAAQHFRDAALVTAGHNQAARYIEAAERLERESGGHASNPPRRGRADLDRNAGSIAGYIPVVRTGATMQNFNGKPTGWVLSEVVQEYRNQYSDKSAAVILTHGRRRGVHAVGYLLVDGGSLFRGVVSDSLDFHDLRNEAKAESESWAERDAEDEARDEFED